jgi:hypothetical protein
MVSLVMGAPVFAAQSPAKASATCRQTIAKGVEAVARASLQTTEQCHKQRKGQDTGTDCNKILPGATTLAGRAQALAAGSIGTKCKVGEAVLVNYIEMPDTDNPGDAVATEVFADVRRIA